MDLCRRCGQPKHKSLLCYEGEKSTVVANEPPVTGNGSLNGNPSEFNSRQPAVTMTTQDAGTQAPPVDTRSRSTNPFASVVDVDPCPSSAGTEGDKDRQPIRKGDRHKPGYMRAYMAAYRARKKMEKN